MKSNQLIDMLNQNIADLHILYVKLHNYHWNVQGSQFFQIHKATEEYYEYVAELYDAMAERVLQLGAKPLATVKEYVGQAKLAEDSRTSLSGQEVLEGLYDDFNYLLTQHRSILSIAEEQGDVSTADMVSSTIGWLEKALWMLKASKS